MNITELIKTGFLTRRHIKEDILDEVLYLHVVEEELTSLKGIEIFKNLERLECNYTNLHCIKDIKHLVNLKELYLDNNKIINLDGLESLINLDHLDISYNYITSLKELKNLKNISRIRCSNNFITSLKELEDLKKIIDIKCNDNLLEDLIGIESLDLLEYCIYRNNPCVSKYPRLTTKELQEKIWSEVHLIKDDSERGTACVIDTQLF